MLGRHEWLNRDPIQEFGGVNLFQFEENDPLNLIDAFGYCPPDTSNSDSNDTSESKEDRIDGAKDSAKDNGEDAAGKGAKKALEEKANEPLAKYNPASGEGPLPGSGKLGAAGAVGGAATEAAMGFAQAGPGLTKIKYLRQPVDKMAEDDDDDFWKDLDNHQKRANKMYCTKP